MRIVGWITLVVLAVVGIAVGWGRLAADPVKYAPTAGLGTLKVASVLYDWKDTKRDRLVPVKIYYPREEKGPLPIVLFSHGLGGTREGYGYLGEYWASHGYVSVHLQHIHSDDSVWKDKADPMAAMRAATQDLQEAMARPRDVSFAIDQLETLQREGDTPLKGRLDLARIGMAGHSYGSFTTLAIAGQRYKLLGREITLADTRVKAAIPMSSPIPATDREYAFGKMRMPCLHMTGTLDEVPMLTDETPEHRKVPYQLGRGADRYLLVFTGGDHLIFSGRGAKDPVRDDAHYQALIKPATLAYWDAYLRGNDAAKTWLTTDDGMKTLLGKDGTFEFTLEAAK